MKKNKGNKAATPPVRSPRDWDSCNFKVDPELKKKIAADMVVTCCPTEAEYFRFLLRTRFERTK